MILLNCSLIAGLQEIKCGIVGATYCTETPHLYIDFFLNISYVIFVLFVSTFIYISLFKVEICILITE